MRRCFGCLPSLPHLSALAGALAALLAAATPAQAGTPSVYVANQASNNASQYNVGAAGALTPLSPTTVGAGTSPSGVAVSPDGASVYVASHGNFCVCGTVSQYNRDAGGMLTPKSPATVAAGAFADGVAVSPNGTSVYVTNLLGSSVSQYDVGGGGALAPKSPATVAAGGNPTGIAASPDGASVYVANQSSGDVSQYNVGAGGALTPKSPATVPVASGVCSSGSPIGVAVSPNGQSVYVTDRCNGVVNQYTVGSGGTLTPKSPATVATGTGPIGVAVSPDGGSVYVANGNGSTSGPSTVSQYSVGAGEKLIPKSPATVAAGTNPTGIALSPDGASVYATNR